uniref:U8-theraphotoxin-Hhn1c 2 n=1 Tax=Cyriopagopus hainanus TaxID=2781057 RepID=H14C2_CYRHA|nr:RecName: Full=U8-theraphotoxin-Hhn1c 2; Short=U8-TRTX-Hhn1c 2; AltName: Full=Hainantoxin-XIV-3.2; Short=HNTX-XIV-3.2; Flags: Precursor [Haplopelma hainanum]ADB56835.1 HNTX-XIV-3.2 precursor [Haplopelma hainanum]
MKVVLLVCLVWMMAMMELVSCECWSQADCSDGHCCAGSSFSKNCRPYGGDGEQCEPRNKYEVYSTGCPCEENLMCSVINRCQSA